MITVEKRCVWIPLSENDDEDDEVSDNTLPTGKVITNLRLGWDELETLLKKSDAYDILPEQELFRVTVVDGGLYLTMVMEDEI